MKFSIVLASILFILSPVLSNYVFLGVLSIGDVSLITSLLFFINKLKISKFFIVTFLMCVGVILLSIFPFVIIGNIPKSFYRASFFLLILPFFISLSKECYYYILIVYLKIASFFSILLFIQLFFYYILTINFTMQLPIPVFEVDTLDIIDPRYAGFRAAAVFKEPSYFAIFISPALLYYAKMRLFKNYIFYFIALIASTSSFGIAIAILSLFVFVSKGIRNKKNLMIVMTVFPFFIISFVSFILLTKNIAILRFFDLFQGGGSLEERFFNMFDVLNGFSLFVNFELSKQVLISNSKEVWYNSFVYLVANFGLIFLLPFLFFCLRLGWVGSFVSIVLLLFTHAFSNSFFTVFFILCFCIYNWSLFLIKPLDKFNLRS